MKVVVCIMGQIRHPDFTWLNFKKFVLDELGADLVTCGPDWQKNNDYTRNSILNIESDPKVETNAERVIEHRRTLFKHIPKVYDQYILSRSDHMWYGPHPKLTPSYIWFMNSEFHFGISDRHWVMGYNDFFEYCENPPKYNPELGGIEGNLVKHVHWGFGTALYPFPMYLTDEKGMYRRIDEHKASQEVLYWPFAFIYDQKSEESNSYPGRAIKITN